MKNSRNVATRVLCGAVLALGLGAATAKPAIASSKPFLGQMTFFPYTFCPRGSAEADGSLLFISEYYALFSLLGTNFGGDGRTSFGLPKREAEGAAQWCIALVGIYPSRS